METWDVRDHLELDIAELAAVSVMIVAGDVSVTAAEGPARLEVERVAGPPVTVRLRDGILRISQPDGRRSALQRLIDVLRSGGRSEAVVALTVPSAVTADLKTVSAPVVVSGLRGRADVKTVSGNVTLSSLHGDVNVKGVSGDVDARGVSGALHATTVSGGVTLADATCPSVGAKTVSGDVILDLDPAPTGVYDLGTVSGNVALRTRAEPDLTVEATSVSGTVTSDFDLAWTDDRPGRRRMHRTIGSGTARLTVRTVSGNLRLLRRLPSAA